jgi:hypothetical protein
MANQRAYERPMPRTTARYRLWRSMRLHQRMGAGFCISDLVATSNCRYDDASRYVRALRRAGYVRLVFRHKSHELGGGGLGAGVGARYSLVKDSGQAAPRLRRDKTNKVVSRVFDPNLKIDIQIGERADA